MSKKVDFAPPPFIKTRAAEDLKSISFLSPSVGKRQVVSALLYRQSGFILLIQHLTNGTKVRSLITKDVALIWLPVLVGDHLLLSFVISEHTLLIWK